MYTCIICLLSTLNRYFFEWVSCCSTGWGIGPGFLEKLDENNEVVKAEKTVLLIIIYCRFKAAFPLKTHVYQNMAYWVVSYPLKKKLCF